MTTAFVRMGRIADQVRAESRRLDPVKVVVTLLMVVPFLVGWLLATAFALVWAVLSWVWTAGVIGWRTARGEGSS